MVISIQILRGIAALLVAISHLPIRFTVGFFGVDLFFVVSGFVMTYTTGSGYQTARNFLFRRAVRVIPLYWIVTSIGLVSLLHEYRHVPLWDLPQSFIVASYMLFPLATGDDRMDFYPLISQGWTLEYEMFFYICFAITLWLNPRRVTLTLGPVLCAFCAFGAVVDLPVPLFYYARTNTLEFVYGMGIARLFTSGIRLPFPVSVLMLVCASGAAYAFAPYSDEWDILRGFGWGIPAAGIITAATLSQSFPRNGFSRCLEALGQASYSLYLTHEYAYDAVRALIPASAIKEPVSLWVPGVMLVCAVALGFLTYVSLERPLTRFLQACFGRHLGTVPSALPVR